MKGLFIKDLYLLSMQKNFLGIFLIICVMMLGTGNGSSFIISYVAIMSAFLVIGTVSYDEMNHGNAFLFTLPVSRKSYAAEKYLFGIVIGLIGCISALLLTSAFSIVGKGEADWVKLCFSAISSMGMVLCFLAVMLPAQMKFGGEKGRIVAVLTAAVILLAGWGVSKIASFFQIRLDSIWLKIQAVDPRILYAGTIVLFCLLLFISYLISVRIMEKKEF